MDPTAIVAIILAAIIVAPFVYATFRLRRNDGRVRFFEVLQEKKLPIPDAQSEASVRSAAHAVRRCVNCSAQDACDRAIAQRDWNALSKICPNEDYIEGLRVS